MPAGDSAASEARRQLALAEAHEREAERARVTAGRYGIAATTEKQTARALAPLAAAGYHLLADRAWPGSRRAQVDMVVVGPGGVFIVDTKAWAEVSIQGDRIFRGQEDVTDDLMSLADLGYVAEAELAEVGLPPGEVSTVAVLAGRAKVDERVGPVRVMGERDVLRFIAARGQRLTATQVDVVLSRALTFFRQLGSPAPVDVTVPDPVIPAPRPEPLQDALISEEEVSAALLEGMMAAPIEDWMTFLHPAQAKTVRRSFNGPSRIRGAAGTGKTVVGLHRAAYLARTRPGRVLVTTYVRTLPSVLRGLLERMAPDVAGQVDFLGVHQFARIVLDERGTRLRTDTRAVTAAWTSAWARHGTGTALDTGQRGRDYWYDEIQHVIKGRGITRFEQYADLPRSGRRHKAGPVQRRAVWDLLEAYQAELASRGVHDFADQILLAEKALAADALAGRYSAVVVDEAQDLSCAMIRMLHRLVGDTPDGLTLIGDGQQTLYPGGFSLGEAGISVTGRATVLDINYRNTTEILEFASRLVTDDEYADIEGAPSRGDRPVQVPRTGPRPLYVRCRGEQDRQAQVVERVRAVVREIGTSHGDVGVLCVHKAGAQRAADTLRRAGVPVVLLEDYDGRPTDAVKVGTVKRAKGLEFKQVLLPDVREDWFRGAAAVDEAESERAEYRRRELYVGMTRARDGLWVAAI
ncbi:nuclease-related domain-containing DEAD/DEAH box helicase [Cellulomonas cellasea]|uniref:DNA 3'-5' helicase n=1 Tax=Cellulomonas cellasea TaxID=43670 RepID=A0A7W4YCS7_9CELL|nr:UvrD-helicase domain-containing protein [Cellulomonas cellasea]MBB2924444.1 hypothetical protein [Cellulomonas cellasea]